MIDQRHISGSTTGTIVRWVETVAGPEAVERLLETAGDTRPVSELLDETGWSSYEQATALLEAAVAVSGMPEAGRRIGEYVFSQHMGTEVASLLRSLGSPSELLRNIAASGAKFSTILVMEPVEIGEDRAVLAGWTVPGIPRHRLLCDFTAGILSEVPALFGMEPAEVWESECQARGGARCVYHLEWDRCSGPDVDPKRRVAYLESQLAALQTRFNSLQRMATELVSADDVESVLALITRRAGVAVRATRYLLAVRVGGRLDLHSDGLGPGQEEEIAAEILEDTPDDHGGSRIIVDVRSGDHHYGRLAALFPEGTRFFPQERELLEAYAAYAAAILNTATALEETRRQNRTASVLLSLARSLSVVALPREVAGTLVRAVTNLVECESAAVLLWEEATHRLRLTAASGVNPGIESTLTEVGITMTDTPELSAMLTRPEPRFYDYATADAFHRSVIGPERPSIAVVPILAQGTFFGVLAVGMQRDLASLQADSDLTEQLAGIAYQAGAALQNAALLDQVRHQALHDSLTGLPNRSLLADRVERALVDAERSGDRVGLAFLDLDRFKKINDTLGHRAGDALLVQVAERISRTLRASDTVARLGGDEFVLLVPHLHRPDDAEQVSKSVLDALLAPFRVDGQELFIAASIGLSVSGESCRDYEELLKQADMAMYRAKARGGASVERYVASHDDPTQGRLALEADLHVALEREQMIVVYQPQVDLTTGGIVGAEALVRWAHPVFGLLPPADFLAIAEETELIVDVDLWVLAQAAVQAAAWRSRFGPWLRMAVNVSNRTVLSPRLEEAVVATLERTGIDPRQLELELTEKVLDRGSPELRNVVDRLRHLGLRVAIDDFGTGTSSLGRLRDIRVDTLKIDRVFLRDLDHPRDGAPLVAAILDMGQALGLHVVAEGVEHAKQAAWLRAHGCTAAQGYLFSRPVRADRFEALDQISLWSPGFSAAVGTAGRLT